MAPSRTEAEHAVIERPQERGSTMDFATTSDVSSDDVSVTETKRDSKTVDAKKYPKHAATQRCENCALWQGASSDPWAGCAMFGRKQVAGEGWCTAWAKKPG